MRDDAEVPDVVDFLHGLFSRGFSGALAGDRAKREGLA
jgi:hypothetical protein